MSIVKDTALARLITKIKAFGNDNFVKYSESQSLTDAQKLQARNNIGADTGAVKYDAAQSLTAAQKSQARTNIGAISQEESIVIDDTAPEDTSVKAWVDTSEGMLVDAGYVFGNVWDLTFLASGWTLTSGKYYQTVAANGLDHHFQLLTWIPDTATSAQYDAFVYVDSCYSSLDGTVTMAMTQQPTVDIPIKVKYHESIEAKHFDDYVETANVANNLTTTDAGKVLDARQGKVVNDALTSHTDSTSNPHSVTKAQVGLGNVDNTSDVNKPISTATQTALDAKAARATSATTGHVAKFDANGNPIDSGYATNNILGLSYTVVSTWS